MRRIIFVGVTQDETGVCNAQELCSILADLRPVVIFEELSPQVAHLIYKGEMQDTLASKALKLYVKDNDVLHFAVDLELSQYYDVRLKNEVVELQELLAQYEKFNSILYEAELFTAEFGFEYLNSQQYFILQERILLAKHEILKKHDKRYLNTEIRVETLLTLRVEEMFNNILICCSSCEEGDAVFLVDAGLKQCFYTITDNNEDLCVDVVEWVYYKENYST